MSKVVWIVKEVVEWIAAIILVGVILFLIYLLIGLVASIGFNVTIGKAFGVKIPVLDMALGAFSFNLAYQLWNEVFVKDHTDDIRAALLGGGNNPANSLPNLGRRSGASSGCCKNLRRG